MPPGLQNLDDRADERGFHAPLPGFHEERRHIARQGSTFKSILRKVPHKTQDHPARGADFLSGLSKASQLWRRWAVHAVIRQNGEDGFDRRQGGTANADPG